MGQRRIERERERKLDGERRGRLTEGRGGNKRELEGGAKKGGVKGVNFMEKRKTNGFNSKRREEGSASYCSSSTGLQRPGRKTR